MKYLTIIVLFSSISLAFAQDVTPSEEGWRGMLRPYMIQLLGIEQTNSLIGLPPDVPKDEMQLPAIPQIVKSATDLKTYKSNEARSSFGKEYLLQPKEKLQSFDLAFVQELFWATRRSKPTDEDVSKWMNALEQGASREGVYRAVVLDEVYATLESYDDQPTENLIKFMQSFSQEFLGVSYKDETLKKTNLFMMKRITSEKILEIIDVFEEKPDDLFRWYAIASARIAKDFPTIWNNPLRSSVEPARHYSWAKSVPFQIIKLEIVIKIHFAMNSLQKI